ncbi:translation initiation factor IF-2 subunit gamma [Candidatus Pacearchaeota archaeon]|nr:translation initiation factor IF-2 subunit gamma [Candidatus Pacearchaeota archaeon]
MTKESVKELPELNIGVVGHIDHGKTTLLSKLTGKFTDTHSEELKRGITIKLGYAEMIIYDDNGNFNNEKIGKPVRYISFIDSPGHEMLMATMLSGAAIIDSAILVIAANEGIKPQTKEHFMALQAKKIKNIIIVQNKIDLVSKEKALENYKEIKEFVKGTTAENSPVIPISAQQGVNIGKLLKALWEIPIPERDKTKKPIFIIARSFDINRPGTEIKNIHGGILGGILKEGNLKVGEEIEIKPGIAIKRNNQYIHEPVTTKIISIQKGDLKVNEVFPGASISIETELDPFMTKTDSLTGSVASTKGNLPDIMSKVKIKAELFKEVLGKETKDKVTELKTKEMLMLSVNTTITVGTVEKISGDIVEMNLNIPIIGITKDNVGIARNINGHWRLIGFGEIVR